MTGITYVITSQGANHQVVSGAIFFSLFFIPVIDYIKCMNLALRKERRKEEEDFDFFFFLIFFFF